MSSSHREGVGSPRVEEVSDGVYAYIQPDGSWFINNCGFLVDGRGVTSIDACSTERRTIAYTEAIGRVTDKPVRLLVNTHHHGDHTHGNYLFPNAGIVGHEATRREILAAGLPTLGSIFGDVDWGAVELDPPFLTYREQVTLWSGEMACEVRHVGQPAHTTNDSIVWLPDRSVLFSGDLLFNEGTPFLLSGSVSGAIEVLEQVIRPLGAETIVPGHGPVAGPELIDDVLGYLRLVDATARQALAAGLGPLDAARDMDLGEYAGLHDPERIVGNLHRAMAELRGTPRGGPLDIVAAFTDMVAYNGGKPLTCYV